MNVAKKKRSKGKRRRSGGAGGMKRRSGGGGRRRARSSGGGGRRRRAARGPLDDLRLSGTEVAIAIGTALTAGLLARRNAKAIAEAKGDEEKAGMALYRKANLLKPVGVTGTLAAGATGLAVATDLPYVKAIAVGLGAATAVQLAQHGGLYSEAAQKDTARQGQIALGGLDELAMGGEVIDERVSID